MFLFAQEGDSADDVRRECPETASIKLQVENTEMGSLTGRLVHSTILQD